MKIQSKFHDYYDSALSTGFADDQLYLRSNQAWSRDNLKANWNLTSEKNNPDNFEPNSLKKINQKLVDEAINFESFNYSLSENDQFLSIEPFYIIVGGCAHKGVWVNVLEKVKKNPSLNTIPNACVEAQRVRTDKIENLKDAQNKIYDFNKNLLATVKFVGAIYSDQELEDVIPEKFKDKKYNGGLYKNYSYAGTSICRLPLDFIKWLKDKPNNNEFYSELMKERITCAVVTRSQISNNPKLADWQFFKKLDAFSCMQEISMFMGNISAPDNVPIVIEDKYRIAQHGFDQQSFRKSATKHATPKIPKRPYPG